MTDMRVILQGYGTVGSVTAAILREAGHEVGIHDPAKGREATGRCDVLVICTPCLTGDLDPLPEGVTFDEVVVRSTVKPDAFESLPEGHRHHWPEFLRECSAEADARHPDMIVWGSDTPIRGELTARNLLGSHFDVAPFLWGSLVASTLIKLGINALGTAKILVANALYDACGRDDDCYRAIRRGIVADHRFSSRYMDIWQDGFRGAGGKCLPKDLRILTQVVGMSPTNAMLQSMQCTNENLMEDVA